MKSIDTLIPDIYDVLREGVDLAPFVHEEPDHNKGEEYLRLSSIGQPCERKLWYTINQPETQEPFEPHTKMKFAIGHIIEHVVIDLAKKAEHKVTYEQEEVDINGVLGHSDCVIDDVVVDVKSASPYGFLKFEAGLTREDDGFGYLPQLASYLLALRDLDHNISRNTAAFLAIQKVTGKLHLDVHEFSDADLDRVLNLIEERKEIVKQERIPPRGFSDEPDGASGNRKLPFNCAYCDRKHTCWPGLRTFFYSNGPRFLTQVKRLPNVPEGE